MFSSSRVEKLYNSLGISNYLKSVKSTKGAKTGFGLLGIVFGSLCYYNYNKSRVFSSKYSEFYQKLHQSHAIDLNSLIWYNTQKAKYENIISQMNQNDYNNRFFMSRCKVTGSFDHSKEILVPNKKNNEEGYLVFTPFYYADFTGKLVENSAEENNFDNTNLPDRYLQKDAIIVNRGW